MSHGEMTTDHEVIRRWAESRGGHPATVKATASGDEAGIRRLYFEPADEGLEEASWQEFFEKSEVAGLAFPFQDGTAEGSTSRFHKFISRSSGAHGH